MKQMLLESTQKLIANCTRSDCLLELAKQNKELGLKEIS